MNSHTHKVSEFDNGTRGIKIAFYFWDSAAVPIFAGRVEGVEGRVCVSFTPVNVVLYRQVVF